jgi:hypothetical protein
MCIGPWFIGGGNATTDCISPWEQRTRAQYGGWNNALTSNPSSDITTEECLFWIDDERSSSNPNCLYKGLFNWGCYIPPNESWLVWIVLEHQISVLICDPSISIFIWENGPFQCIYLKFDICDFQMAVLMKIYDASFFFTSKKSSHKCFSFSDFLM